MLPSLPRWFRAMVVLELAGLAIFVILAIRLLTGAAHAVGDIAHWNAPTAPSPAPSTVRLPGGGVAGQAMPPADAITSLDRDTGATTTLQMRLLQELSNAVRQRLQQIIDHAERH